MSRWVCCDNCLHKNICGDRMEMLRKDFEFNGNGCMRYCTDAIFDDKRKLEAKLADMERCAENNKKVAELVSAEHNAKIENLEKQLAESEGKNEALEDDYNKLINQYNKQYNDLCKEIQFHSSARERFVKKVEELKQQLAEKENRIIELSNGVREIEKIKDEKSKEIRDFHIQRYKDLLNRQNQYKISFCIEQLEKVKDHYRKFKNTNMGIIKRADIVLFINNQIEELKKEIK